MGVVVGLSVAAGVASVIAQGSSGDHPRSPEAVVRQYYELSFAGEQLSPEGQRKIDALFLTPPITHPPISDEPITVIKSFVVKRDLVKGSKASWFTVNWLEFGSIDPSLRFVRREGSRPNTPVRGGETYDVERGRDGQWKIGTGEFTIRVGVEAAIRYVSAARDRASDPAIKANADRTLSSLKQLSAGTASTAGTTGKTPRAVVEEFCQLDGEGGQLTPEGWRAIAALFTQPGPPPHPGKVMIVLDCVTSNADIGDDGKAGVMTESIGELAWLHPDTALLEGIEPPGGVKVRRNFSLVQTNAGWKIEGAVPDPYVTVVAAIRYVTALRDKTTSERVRKNAERALAGLRRQLPAPAR
jgi:hypothetical protein